MKRTIQITISALTTLAVTAAFVLPASAYESINAAENPVAGTDRSSGPTGTSINAILGESTPAPGGRVEVTSTPNAIEGGSNVSEPVVVTSTESTGFNWGDALIGAGGALVLVLFTGGVMTLIRRRRAPRVQPIA